MREITIDDLDLIAEVRLKCLAVDVLVTALAAVVHETSTDERVAMLVDAVEASTHDAWGAVQRVSIQFQGTGHMR